MGNRLNHHELSAIIIGNFILLICILLVLACEEEMPGQKAKETKLPVIYIDPVQDGNDLLAIVDKEYGLPEDYQPADLVLVKDYAIKATVDDRELRQLVIPDLQAMVKAANQDNCNLVVLSAYRSYEKQETTYKYWVNTLGQEEANRVSARPGHSEHQLGTTIDFTSASVNYELTLDFAQTPSGKWLKQNAYKYGFIMSYAPGYEVITGYQYEPWHYRYFGRRWAKEIYQSKKLLYIFLREHQAVKKGIVIDEHIIKTITYGYSYNKLPLKAYSIGSGKRSRAIIGGIHGGYEGNTVQLVEQLKEYLVANPYFIPNAITLYILPCTNPDGFKAGKEFYPGRMNGNGVDLNRNWDCNWQEEGVSSGRKVNTGTYPFSEPENVALRDFFLQNNIEAGIFYHSAMGSVFYGGEKDDSRSYDLAKAVSAVTGYALYDGMPGQTITGDAADYMAALGRAFVEIELTDHLNTEFERNRDGLIAFLNWSLDKEVITGPDND